MTDSNLLISWIIIGRNWADTISQLIESLNNQTINSDLVELIIIDDASTDESEKQFEQINFQNKKIIILEKHSGRTVAQNTGLKIAQGKYCLFTQSNTIPEKLFLEKYINLLSQTTYDGAAGVISYSCQESTFQKYLNHHKRGLNKCKNNNLIPLEYILFGNCAIKTTLLKQVHGFNEKLIGYGGEEIELVHRINNIRKLQIVKIDAKVLRDNHPDFNSHRLRLIEFGQTNFKRLPFEIKENIIPSFFLWLYIILPISLTYHLLLLVKRLFNINSFMIIRMLLGLSILKGYKQKFI